MKIFLALTLLGFVSWSAALPRTNRIVGGESTTIERYPSIVQVDFLGVFSGVWSQSCAANILTSRHVLSAAHCFEGPLYASWLRRIRAGSTYRNTGGIISNVVEARNHHSYGSIGYGYDGDISVVRNETPFVWTPVVQAATIMAHGFEPHDNMPVVKAGWGATSQGGSASPDLQHVTMYTVNNDECSRRYDQLNDSRYVVTENMICAGILDTGGRDACQGDSGGPLYYDHIVIGIVSWGHGCANETYPGVSTAVSQYTNWIINSVVNLTLAYGDY